MSKILVIDNVATSRQVLITILAEAGHQTLEASDGLEGLELIRKQYPDLVITDLIMPKLDGYQLVHQLRSDPHFKATPILFYTHLDYEASHLGVSCGKSQVLTRPSAPEAVLNAVTNLLSTSDGSSENNDLLEKRPAWLVRTFSDALEQLKSVSLRFSSLIELAMRVGLEHDPIQIVETFCRESRIIIPSMSAAIGILDCAGKGLARYFHNAKDNENYPRGQRPRVDAPRLKRLFQEHKAIRLFGCPLDPIELGLPPGYPTVNSFLAMPIATSNRTYGWMFLTNRIGQDEFSEEDERIGSTLAFQLGVFYENAKLYEELQSYTKELEAEVLAREKAEQVSKESERKTRLIIENGNDTFFAVDSTGRINEWSHQAEKLLGWSRKEALGVPAANILSSKNDLEETIHQFHSLLSFTAKGTSNQKVECKVAHKDGHHLPVELVTFQAQLGNEESLCVLMHDITEHKLAQEMSVRAVQAEQRIAKTIFEHAPVGIVWLDPNFKIDRVNPTFLEQFGFSANMILGSSLFEILEGLPKERLIKGLDDGSPFTVENHLLAAQSRSFQKGGSTYFDLIMWPIKDMDDSRQGMVMLTLEVTERVKVNRQREDFVATLTHDLKTPLVGADRTFTLLLEGKMGDLKQEQAKLIAMLQQSNSGLLKMVKNLLRVYRYEAGLQSFSFETVNLTALISGCIQELSPLAHSRNLQIAQKDPQKVVTIVADRAALNRVLINLLSNAIKFSHEGKKIEIRATCSNDNVIIEVEDSGQGINESDLSHLFDRFWKGSRSYSASTGLGLYMCRQIVETHRGTINCQSKPGSGTIFTVTLPQNGPWESLQPGRQRGPERLEPEQMAPE